MHTLSVDKYCTLPAWEQQQKRPKACPAFAVASQQRCGASWGDIR